MKKIRNILLVALALLTLASCDLLGGGGEKADATLYHLTLSYSANVSSNEAFKQADLTAKYAYGVDGNLPRDEYEIEELKKAGATDEDIAKAGARQDDGSYYFFDQDPMYLNAPDVTGYVLQGFYFKGTDNLAYNPNPTLIDGEVRKPRWNMEGKNVEIEARYTVLSYTVSYCYGIDRGPDRTHSGLMPSTSHSNPAVYNYETHHELTLAAPTEVIEGYEFKFWYYNLPGSGEKIVCETFPTVYDEDIIHTISYDGNNPQYGITLFAFYDIPSYEVSISVDEGLSIILRDYLGEIITLSDEPLVVEYGTTLDLYVDTSEIYVTYPEFDHDFDGVYINNVKVPDLDYGGGLFVPNSRPNINITSDTVIEVKVKALPSEE